MSFAVIKTGGKQYKVSEGDEIVVENIKDKKSGDKVVFDEVMFTSDGKSIEVGAPIVKGKKVEGKVIEEGKAKKVSVIRFKAKSRHRRERGHRQQKMTVKINKVS